MIFGPALRKLLLAVHIAVSVAWLGAAGAYLAVAVAALASGESARMQAAFPILKLIGWTVILPLCGAALLSGVVQSLGTRWGLVRHYWVLAKLALTLAATAVLLGHLPAVNHAARLASAPASRVSSGVLPAQLVVHAAGGALVLLVITALSVFKPWGLTPIGRRWSRLRVEANAQARRP